MATGFIADTTGEVVGITATPYHSGVLQGVDSVHFTQMAEVNEIKMVATSNHTSESRGRAVANVP